MIVTHRQFRTAFNSPINTTGPIWFIVFTIGSNLIPGIQEVRVRVKEERNVENIALDRGTSLATSLHAIEVRESMKDATVAGRFWSSCIGIIEAASESNACCWRL
jgi:predicted PhzF superfamily epimerase YddE/YHI9